MTHKLTEARPPYYPFTVIVDGRESTLSVHWHQL